MINIGNIRYLEYQGKVFAKGKIKKQASDGRPYERDFWVEILSVYDNLFFKSWFPEKSEEGYARCNQDLIGSIVLITLEECKTSAALYESRRNWANSDQRLYQHARKNGWLDTCCAHMKTGHKVYTLEHCIASAKKYNSAAEWRIGDYGTYRKAAKEGWINNIFPPVDLLDKCKKSAERFTSRGEWSKQDASLYQIAYRSGWLDDCCGHMTKPSDKVKKDYIQYVKDFKELPSHKHPSYHARVYLKPSYSHFDLKFTEEVTSVLSQNPKINNSPVLVVVDKKVQAKKEYLEYLQKHKEHPKSPTKLYAKTRRYFKQRFTKTYDEEFVNKVYELCNKLGIYS